MSLDWRLIVPPKAPIAGPPRLGKRGKPWDPNGVATFFVSELTAAGASTTETMLAGGWKTARMVAHYSAGASAERGAVAKYL